VPLVSFAEQSCLGILLTLKVQWNSSSRGKARVLTKTISHYVLLEEVPYVIR
jgi:hypothetical protein